MIRPPGARLHCWARWPLAPRWPPRRSPPPRRRPIPTKPITIVVPFSAGGTTDILARIVGQALSTELGQPVIVDNRAGAGGNIGGALAAKRPGRRLHALHGHGRHARDQPSLYKKLPFDPVKDFAPLTRVAMVPNLLVAHPSRPYKTVQGADRLRQGQPGQGELRLVRQRQLDPPVGRAVQQHGQGRHGARAVQGQRARR